jgi:hypothetical protein
MMGVRIDENGNLIAGNVAVPSVVVPAIEAFFRERLTTPPTDDEMEPLTDVIRHSIDRWGDLFPTPEVARYVADDVEAAGFRRQGPITDAARDAARKAAYLAWIATDVSPDGPNLHTIVDAALEAAREA